MRDWEIRQTAVEALAEAHAAAIAGIGLRGREASRVMRLARTKARRAGQDTRWGGIVKAASIGRKAVRPTDFVSLVEVDKIDESGSR